MRMSSLWCAAGALVVVCGAARAGNLIGSHSVVVAGEASLETFALHMFLALSEGDGPGDAGYVGGTTIQLIDFPQGNVYSLTGDLASMASALTDGVDGSLTFGALLPDASTVTAVAQESAVFGGKPGLVGPDLLGYVITDIAVIGTSLQFGDGGPFEATIEYWFFGERVPSPGTCTLAAGVGLLIGARRRR